MSKWLVKSEPDVYSIDDFLKDQVAQWEGVRNYQARNYLKAMKKGEEVLFYHSSAELVGVAGVAKVFKEAYPDQTQFNARSEFYDQSASKDNPRWFAPDLKFVQKFKKFVALEQLKKEQALKKMVLLKRGTRLSVQPVSESEFKVILRLGTGG